MRYKKFVSEMFRFVLMACLILACEQGHESPLQTLSDTQTSPAAVDISLPRLSEFQHQIVLNSSLESVPVDATIQVPVSVTNTSHEIWPTQPVEGFALLHVVTLSYRWLDSQGYPVEHDASRTRFPHAIKPGQTVSLDATVQTPNDVGNYVLQFTAMQEGVASFVDAGAEPLEVKVAVVTPAQIQGESVVSEEKIDLHGEPGGEEAGALSAGETRQTRAMREGSNDPPEAPPAELTEENQTQIRQLLLRAEQQFQKKNFTTPKGDNTLDTCLQILARVPRHPVALRLIQNMEQQYRDWANSTSNTTRRQTYSEKADSLADSFAVYTQIRTKE